MNAGAHLLKLLPCFLTIYLILNRDIHLQSYLAYTFRTATPLGHNNITELTQTLYCPFDMLPLLLINFSHQIGGFIYFFIHFAGKDEMRIIMKTDMAVSVF